MPKLKKPEEIPASITVSVTCDSCTETFPLLEEVDIEDFRKMDVQKALKKELKAQGFQQSYDSDHYQTLFGIICKDCLEYEASERNEQMVADLQKQVNELATAKGYKGKLTLLAKTEVERP